LLVADMMNLHGTQSGECMDSQDLHRVVKT